MLVLAPRGRDFDIIRQVLDARGIASMRCGSQRDLLAGLDAGSAAIVTDDAFGGAPEPGLKVWLDSQPPWSDFPFIVLTTRRPGAGTSGALGMLRALGNAVLLERPVNAETLVRAASAAIRARSRQIETRRTLEELSSARATVQSLNFELENRIVARTRELAAANDRLMAEIAERERAQNTLIQAQKMEAVGRLTGGIAHDFNNLLQVVNMSLELLARRTSDPALASLAGKAKQAVGKGARLTGQLLSFARVQSLLPRPTEVNALLVGMLELIAVSAGSNVAARLDLCEAPLWVTVDANQLEMALLNLAVNAKDAMPATGGTLTLRTREVEGPQADLPTDRHAVIEVIDSGSGIPQHLLSKVFEPFFTTKPVGSGTGLGLSQVYGFAKQSGGTVRISSAAGQGTTVQIWFPADRAPAAPAASAADHDVPRTVTPRRILVVEDDAEVRRVIVDSLGAFGHSVASSVNGEEGLASLRADTPDVMIVDYAMPGMTGAELIKAARRLHPGLPIVLATGYADMVEVGRVLPAQSVLFKPFDVASLLSAVEKACDVGVADRAVRYGA